MYIARQAIFNRDMEVYAYELLYRASKNSTGFDGLSSNIATAAVIAGTFENGVDIIADKKKVFINFDEEMLLSDMPYLLKPSELVIENLETVKLSSALIKKISKYKKDGYLIALDDFVYSYDDYPLVKYANIIKYDLIETPLDTIKEDVAKALRDGKIILAEKVETNLEFEEAKEMGFHLFQGYFFQKPHLAGKSEEKNSYVSQYGAILSELNKEEPSYNALAEIFQTNIDLSYKLIVLSGKHQKTKDIKSIKKALTLVGLQELRTWISLLMIRDVGKNNPPELMRLSLIRAKFAEELCKEKVFNSSHKEAFMLGLFSTIDAFLDMTMEEALKDIPVSDDFKNALLKGSGDMGEVLKFILDYEKGNMQLREEDLYKEELIFKLYTSSVFWGTELYNNAVSSNPSL